MSKKTKVQSRAGLLAQSKEQQNSKFTLPFRFRYQEKGSKENLKTKPFRNKLTCDGSVFGLIASSSGYGSFRAPVLGLGPYSLSLSDMLPPAFLG
jgi:hypothetical protein